MACYCSKTSGVTLYLERLKAGDEIPDTFMATQLFAVGRIQKRWA